MAGVQTMGVTTLALVLVACGSGKTAGASPEPTSTDATSSGPTTTRSPSTSGHDLATGRQDLEIMIQAALRATASGQEYICIAGECRLWNVSWSKGGRVYDVAYPSQNAGQSGLEVRHEPGRMLERGSEGDLNRCWWPAEPQVLAQFSRPVLPRFKCCDPPA
jgi:hypothetical protein